MTENWHALSSTETMQLLGTSENGLSAGEAKKRLIEFGYNELLEKKKKSAWIVFFEQFANFLMLILILACVFAVVIGETIDAFVIGLIVVANAIIGFWQESKAEKAMDALKRMSGGKAKVERDGKLHLVDVRDLVPGDLIVLEQGDKVPADARLLETMNLQVDEASLTGESVPVEKKVMALAEKTVLPDRKNLLFMNTVVSFGRGKAIVVSTGMKTAFGKIAATMQEIVEQETPLAKRLDEFGKKLGVIVLVIAVLLLLLLSFKSNFAAEKIVDSLLVAVSLAVAAIPEGLPAVVTITLAFGMQAMAKQNAIVRKATAVETLGCTTVICSDKTGTITRNEMNVKKIGLFDNDFEFTGDGFETKGIIVSQGKALAAKEVENFSGLQLLLKDAVLCNNSDLESLVGDSTELALLVAAKKASLEKKDFGKEKLVAELPFDSDRKRMSVVFGNSKEKFLYCKGSVESVLAVSNYFFVNGKEKKLGEKEKQEFLRKNNDLASAGLRVLGFAFKRLEKKEKDFSVKETEKDLVFLGLVGMIDSARSESKAAIELAKLAGIKVKMITGDHKLTAIAVGKEIGLIEKESEAITGLELDELNDKELAERIERLNIFARVSPEHKLRIISALQSKHEVVAMTGDGVNDALALKKADIGIAMGITGTDVAKEASSMVLADDNFATIVSAVREGRKVFANIKNFIRYLLATNIGEVIIVSFAAFFWNLLPLLPIHILFLNLVTDGLPALALGKEKLDEDLMKRPPRKKNENMINEMFPMLFVSGLVATVVVLVAFLLQNPFVSANLLKAQTIAFATLVIFELVFVFDCRSETKNLFQVGLFSNKALLLAVFVSLLLTVAVIQVSLISQFFKTVPLSFGDWLLVALLSLFSLVVRPLTNVLLSAKKSLFKN